MSSASEAVRPRAQVHRGTVVVAAWWFHPAIVGEAEARRRVLEAWRPGVTVWALEGGHLLKLATPHPSAVESAPGLPLVLDSGVLTSAPLSPKERERLAPPPGAVVLVQAGVARVYGPGALRQVDPGTWLDVSAWRRVRVKGLGAPPAPMKTAVEPVPAPTRERFGPGVPGLAPEAERMLARMEGREVPAVEAEGFFARLRRVFSRKPGEAVLTVRREGLFTRLRRAFRSQPAGAVTVHREGLFARVRSAFRTEAQGAPGSALAPSRAGWFERLRSAFSPDTANASATATGARAGWFLRLLAGMRGDDPAKASQGSGAGEPQGPGALEQLKAWMLRNTPLGALVGRRKGDYLRHLFELFEQGDLDEALRHAIPLGKAMDERARLALGVPSPREELRIQPHGRGGAAQSFGGGPAVFDALRERYRETFRRLEREGRIDEAAFVLAELLDAAEEAVSFLERHGRFQLAAELAEGRSLPPGLVVRQWFLAKDVGRAVAIARRSGVFADAVLRLEKTHPAEAQALRLLWAESLAEAGDWSGAVDVVWPVTSARHLARAWMERGIQAGGTGGAKLLARLALESPDGLDAAREAIQDLLSDETAARAPERLAFATVLPRSGASAARGALLVPTIRSLMRDERVEGLPSNARLLQQLLGLQDPALTALRTDMPAPKVSSQQPWAESPDLPHVRVSMDRGHAGAHAVHDAVVLPGRRVLLALGEAGARLVGPDGRTLAGFDVPAFSLVLSEQGNRALALARRGDLWRVSRLDLVERRATRWCDVELDAWAPTYDGERWFIAVRDTVSMVDTLAAEPRSLWRVPEVGGTVLRMAVDAKHLSFLVLHLTPEQEFEYLDRWCYELPGGPTLRGRSNLPAPWGTPDALALTPDGEAMAGRVAVPAGDEPGVWTYVAPIVARRYHRPAQRAAERAGEVLSQSWRVTRFQKGELHTTVLRTVADYARVTVEFSGTPPQVVRLTEDWCAVHDLLGRVVWLDLRTGEVHRVPVV
ncbi:bpX6 domain-containing protein [Corallococcus sp. EGB]|uniref:bpX6 domain-containing protein n=1 Tax=Corallococcus sp. EGB TaxID=1521117 RepID=UPI001CBC4145|nr:bpX6 domain-containing protein [Corallococcus sp. EGB]